MVAFSLALEFIPGKGFLFAALLPPGQKKKRTTEAVRFLWVV
jgi:hypothetical protein